MDTKRPVPELCRSCANWLGRYSGDPEDQRCNRRWGHEAKHGDFRIRGDDWSSPAYVTKDCKVPKWGPPLQHEGRRTNTNPEMVSGYVQARAPAITLWVDGEPEVVTQSEISEIKTLPNMGNPFQDVEQEREEVKMVNQQLHEDRMGTSGHVGAASDMPAWTYGGEKFSTGLIPLDWALKGGLAPGTRVKDWGSFQTWKTTLAYYMAAQHQQYRDRMLEENFERVADHHGFDATPEALEQAKASQRVVIILGENFDKTWAEAQGLDTERVDVVMTEYLEESLQLIRESILKDQERIKQRFNSDLESWMRVLNYFHVIVDSWDSFAVHDDEHGSNDKKQVLQDDTRMGSRASLLSDFWKVASNASKLPITVQDIGQQRTAMGGGFAYSKGDKGNADAHNARVQLRHFSNDMEDGEQEIELTFEQTQHPGGTNVHEGEQVTIIGTPDGISPELTNLQAAIDAGVVKSSSWLTYVPDDGDKISQQGTNLRTYAQTLKDEGVYDEVYQKAVENYG